MSMNRRKTTRILLRNLSVSVVERSTAGRARNKRFITAALLISCASTTAMRPAEANFSLPISASSAFFPRMIANQRQTPAPVHQYLKMADDELKRFAHITRQTLGF
jgi:hypothetical protein